MDWTKVRPGEDNPGDRYDGKEGIKQNAAEFPVSEGVGYRVLEFVHGGCPRERREVLYDVKDKPLEYGCQALTWWERGG